METFVARQPIFTKKQKIYGYELLFRKEAGNAFPAVDVSEASSKLMADGLFAIGLERLTGGKRAFVNFTRDLLLKKAPAMFPQERLMVEIPEGVEPSHDLVEACREMVKGGYRLVLDDFVYRAEMAPLIAMAKIVKIDCRRTPLKEIEHCLKNLAPYPVKLLAEKVETQDEFKQALELGFDYFQGYFFCKPVILAGKDIPPDKVGLLRIMAEANREDLRFEELEKMISYDLSISYKLLRYINSAYFKRLREVSSIRQAITLLGEKGMRRFVSLIAMTSLAVEKPGELIRASIIRARLCELLGKAAREKIDDASLFTLGLFSMIDAILDESMETVMARLPLAEKIKNALVKGNGNFAEYLKLVSAYESGDWEKVFEMAVQLGIEEDKMPELYLDAVGWADSYSEM